MSKKAQTSFVKQPIITEKGIENNFDLKNIKSFSDF